MPISRQAICSKLADQLQQAWANHEDMPGLDNAIFVIINAEVGKKKRLFTEIVSGAHWDVQTAYEVARDMLETFDDWGKEPAPFYDTIEAFTSGMIERIKLDADLDDRIMDTAIVAVHPEGAAAFGFVTQSCRPSISMRNMIRRALGVKASLAKR